MPEETTELCPMCYEINMVKVGQTEITCIWCGHEFSETHNSI